MNTPAPRPFDEPWQAELFALTLALSDAGHFSWPDWTQAFGATLACHGREHALDGSADYYRAWLETLETLLDQQGLAPTPEAHITRAAWEKAYRTTPHGLPVRLPD